MYDLIKKKRDGGVLTDEEIKFFVDGFVKGEIPDYQVAALLMAIYFEKLNSDETLALTLAIRDSGDTLDLSDIKGIKVDKHSTGGVGDKTTLVIAPILAACGLKVAKMSGRGLGHTGGTIDKLEAIKGFKTNISREQFIKVVNEVGVAVVGQSGDLTPADKKIYALRDVTATVDDISLIVSSIMGKKLATDSDCLLLDVKVGSGAFMKSYADAEKLARVMVAIGNAAGKKTAAMITDMDSPLGNAVGNSIEVVEAINTLKGEGPRDLDALCRALSVQLLKMSGMVFVEAEEKVNDAISNGKALMKLKEMVSAQGGDASFIDDVSLFPSAKYSLDVLSDREGEFYGIDAEQVGLASITLGAGRVKKEDSIDHAAGIYFHKKNGKINVGERICTLYSDNQSSLSAAESIIKNAIRYSGEDRPLIWKVIE